MKRTAAASVSILMILMFLISILGTIPTTRGYSDRTTGKDTYEIIMDAPWRIKQGKTVPVLLMIHDANEARGGRLPVKEITVTIYDEENEVLAAQVFNGTQLGDTTGNNTFIVDQNMWTKDVLFSPSDFTGSGPDYIGSTTIIAVFALLTGPLGQGVDETRIRQMEIYENDMTSFSKWYLGESHSYSNFTENDFDFGAPIEPMSRAGNCIGLDWLAITDDSNSEYFSSQEQYDDRNNKMDEQNGIVKKPLLIPAEEVTAYHENGGAPGNEYGKLLVYGAGYIESTSDPRGNSLSTTEVTEITYGKDGASYAEDILLNNVLNSPWDTYPENITGIEVWKGGDPYSGTNQQMLDRWVSLLLQGKRLYASAGSAAYGEFDRLGTVRTLSFQPDGLSEENVVRSLKWGHTVLTNGPLGIFTGENENGSEFVIGENSLSRLEGKDITIRPEFSCDPEFGEIDEVTLYIGVIGRGERRVNLSRDDEEVQISKYIPANRDAYVRMAVNSTDGENDYHALTNPLWIRYTNKPPTADAGDDQVILLGEEVHFEGIGDDPDGEILFYEWDFDGDGSFDWSSFETAAVDHEYEALGTYTAFFRVTDEGGLFAQDNCTITVTEEIVNTPPRVNAGNDVTVEKGKKVTLTAVVEDDENNVVGYEWSEKGVVLSTTLTLTKVFDVGTHELTFTATDSEGATGSDTVKVTVQGAANKLPSAVLEADKTTVYALGKITFDGSDSSDEDGSILKYNFTFGDGEGTGWQDESSATHSYRIAGTYYVELKVMDDRSGIAVSEKISVRVLKTPGTQNGDDGDEDNSPFAKIKDYVKDNQLMVGGASAAVVLVITIIVIIMVKRKGKEEEFIFKRVDEEIEEDEEAALESESEGGDVKSAEVSENGPGDEAADATAADVIPDEEEEDTAELEVIEASIASTEVTTAVSYEDDGNISQTNGSTFPKKKRKSSALIVLIIVGILVVVGVLAAVVLGGAGVLYFWTSSMDMPDESVSIMHFTVEDGPNTDDAHGCFFIIRAGKGVNINPARHSFFVAERGYSPKKLDFSERGYNEGKPVEGDRNVTYDWTRDGALWSDGEYMGFDMPNQDNMKIDIVDGNIYEVMIKNPQGEVIFRDSFVYSEQGY